MAGVINYLTLLVYTGLDSHNSRSMKCVRFCSDGSSVQRKSHPVRVKEPGLW